MSPLAVMLVWVVGWHLAVRWLRDDFELLIGREIDEVTLRVGIPFAGMILLMGLLFAGVWR